MVRWAQGWFGWGAENLAPTEVQFPDPPLRSKSLYGLYHLGRSSAILHITKCHKTMLRSTYCGGGVLLQLYQVEIMDVSYLIELTDKERLVRIM
jgi:hypothetical protein